MAVAGNRLHLTANINPSREHFRYFTHPAGIIAITPPQRHYDVRYELYSVLPLLLRLTRHEALNAALAKPL